MLLEIIVVLDLSPLRRTNTADRTTLERAVVWAWPELKLRVAARPNSESHHSSRHHSCCLRSPLRVRTRRS